MMCFFRSSAAFLVFASTSPLVAQTSLSAGSGSVLITGPSDTGAVILTAPEAAPLIVSEGATSGQGVLLEHPSIVSVQTQNPRAETTRPRPRPRNLEVPDDVAEAAVDAVLLTPALLDTTGESQLPAIVVDPEPTHRPNPRPMTVLDDDETALPGAAPDEVAEATATDPIALTAEIDGTAVTVDDTRTAAENRNNAVEVIEAADPQDLPAIAPIPDALHVVERMSARNQPAAISAVVLPASAAVRRPNAQPVVFMVPRHDAAPVLSRPLPEGPNAMEQVFAPQGELPTALSAVLLPSVAAPQARPVRQRIAAPPVPDLFPYSALPPGALPGGPDSLDRTLQPPIPEPEAMAAVLMTDPRPAPVPPAPLGRPMLPPVGEAPPNPEAPPVLPAPDHNALARMVSDTAICWSYANLSAEARWASLSVEVALDETNMPTTQSIRLTGFGRVMSSDAEEAFRAAHGALVGCAEATSADPATTSATLVFDRTGVRLR